MINHLLELIVNDKNQIVKKVVFVIGAGCSKEYGLPLYKDLMIDFLKEIGDKEYQNKSDKELFEYFYQKISTLNPEIRRKILIKLLTPKKESTAYKILCSLMENNICDIVFTTNYDDLIEQNCQNVLSKTYDELKITNQAKQPIATMAEKMVIHLAGDLKGTINLFNDKDFFNFLTDTKENIERLLGSNNIIFVGYTMGEEYLFNIWNKSSQFLNTIIVAPHSNKIVQKLDYQNNSITLDLYCEEFFIKFSNVLFTYNPNIYSFAKLKEEVTHLISKLDKFDETKLVKNEIFENMFNDFLNSSQNYTTIIGKSGAGKSFYLSYLTINANKDENKCFIYINSIAFDKEKSKKILKELALFKNMQICVIFDDFHLSDMEKIEDIATFILDKNFENIKFVIALREGTIDYLVLKNPNLRFLEKNIIYLSEFNQTMIEEGIKKYNISSPNKKIFKLPLFLRIASTLKVSNNFISSLYILNTFAKSIDLENKNFLYEIYKEFYSNQQLQLDINTIETKNYEKNLYELNTLGILNLIENDFDEVITINNELLNEFLFAKIYLSKSKLKDIKNLDTQKTFENFVNSIKNIPFKIFMINSMRFYIAIQKIQAIENLLDSSNNFIKYLTREALTERLELPFNEKYMEDYFLMAVMLLNEKNFEKIYNAFESNKFNIDSLDNLSFYIAANRYKKDFKKFVEYSIEKISDKEFHIGIITFIIYTAYNGYDKELHNNLKNKLKTLDKYEEKIASFLTLIMTDLYKFIFYGSNMPEYFLDKKEYFKDIKKAFFGSLFDLDMKTIKALIDADKQCSDMLSWIFIHILIFKEIKTKKNQEKVLELLKGLFDTGELRYQDFVLTILGHLSKYDNKFLEILSNYTMNMKKNYPKNFYSKTIGNDNEVESQYDPWVPLLSSRIYHNYSADEVFKEFFDIDNQDDEFNIVRILYKLAIDYPNITIKGINKALNIITNDDYKKRLYKILNVIRYTNPNVFWKNLDLALVNTQTLSKYDIDKQSINQIHDWNWFELINSIDFEKISYLFEDIENKTTLEFVIMLLNH